MLLSGGCERSWDPLYGLALPGMRGTMLLQLARRTAQTKEAMAADAWRSYQQHQQQQRGHSAGRGRQRSAWPRWPTVPTAAGRALHQGEETHVRKSAKEARGAAKEPEDAEMKPRGKKEPRERLRIGFLSADYRWHVMAFLTSGLLEEASGSRRSSSDPARLSAFATSCYAVARLPTAAHA